MYDTITAIATGNSNQALSIIRISGINTFKIAKAISSCKNFKPNKIIFCTIWDNHQIIDEVMVASFIGPKSFTGEDMVEISAHGGVINTQRILKLILKYGARLADRGEFSLRAFLNGKMDLLKAEGINNLINAQTLSQSIIAAQSFRGIASQHVVDLKNDLLKIIGVIETNIDYPEYDDVEKLTTQTLIPKLKLVSNKMSKLIENALLTQKHFNGIKVAIIGEPNVGKSSLLNFLINEDKAIVTHIPGTTRDVVEASIEINGTLFHFFDTAGIHHSQNFVENIGIKKTYQKIEEADLIIYLLVPNQKENTQIIQLLEGKKHFKIYNKKDLFKSKLKKDNYYISIKEKDIKVLNDLLIESFPTLINDNYQMLASTRQQALLEQAFLNLQNAIKNLNHGFFPDEAIVDINQGWENLADILGQNHKDELLTEMFSSFCLGK